MSIAALLPPVPQVNRPPVLLSAEQEQRLLLHRIDADQTDLFASDPDPEVRKLGRLALRRTTQNEDPADFFTLGDLCAQHSLHTDNDGNDNLQIVYVGKALRAYRRVQKIASRTVDRNLAGAVVESYIRWVLNVAQLRPTARNIAVGLWAAAELPNNVTIQRSVSQLIRLYPVSSADSEDSEPENLSTPNFEQDTITTAPNPSALFQTPVSEPVKQRVIEKPDDAATYLSVPEQDSPALGMYDMPTLDQVLDPLSSDDNELSWIVPDEMLEPQRSEVVEPIPPEKAPDQPESPPTTATKAAVDTSSVQDFRVGSILIDRDKRQPLYEVSQVLRGGMGVVYLCKGLNERRLVAIKTYQGRFLDNEMARLRFEQEAYTWIQLGKHPHIVQAHKVQKFGDGAVEPRPHIILEYIAGAEDTGSDLKGWIDHNKLDMATAVLIGLHICRGMDYASRAVAGLVHRDLKPANILVRYDGIAKVTDFGLARSLDAPPENGRESGSSMVSDSRLTRAGALVGTVPYMSPEQTRSEEVDLRSDIYAFGAILYEMLTRQQLFRARTFSEWIIAHQTRLPDFPVSALENIPPMLEEIVACCLAKAREDRYQTWEDLLDPLAAVYEILTEQPMPPVSNEASDMALDELKDKAYSLTELDYADEALAVYDEALVMAPKDKHTWALKGRVLRILKRYPEAVTSFDRALQLDPKFGWAWLHKGITHKIVGQITDARKAYQTALQFRPGDTWILYNQADLLLMDHRYADALALLDQVVAQDTQFAAAYTKRGQALMALHRYDQAMEAYDHSIELDQNFAWAWYGKGLLLDELKQFEDANAAFNRVVHLRPKHPLPWYGLAMVLNHQEKYQEALDKLEEAFNRDETHIESWLLRGKVLANMGRYKEALNAHDEVLAHDPGNNRALNGRGRVLEAMKRYEDALSSYKEAAQSMPDSPWPYLRQAELFLKLNQPKDSLSAAKQAAQLVPTLAEAWERQGQALKTLNRFAEALKAYDRATELDPHHAWWWVYKARIYVAIGHVDDAVLSYRRAVEQNTADPQLWYVYGNYLLDCGRYEEAIDAFNRVLRITPNDRMAFSKRADAFGRLNQSNT